MRILIDIGHPAHVHYFKNFIEIFKQKGHDFLIVARNKDVSHQLLEAYDIEYHTRGKGADTILGKLFYAIKAFIKIFSLAKQFKADLYLSCGSPYVALTAWFLKKPHTAIDDTEHDSITRKIYLAFSKVVITPFCYKLDLGKKQIRVDSYTELLALHPNWFKSKSVKHLLGLSENQNYAVLRFVSWKAFHDKGQKGISYEQKKELIHYLESNNYKVFISSEGQLEKNFEKYRLSTPPECIHDVLSNASLFIGEGATMASECTILGTPAIYVNSLNTGYLQEQSEKYGLINLRNSKLLISKVKRLKENNSKENAIKNAKQLINDKIDFTSFLVKYVEDYLETTDNKTSFLKNILNKNSIFLYSYFVILLLAYLVPFKEGMSLNRFEVATFRADHIIHLLVFIPLPFLIQPLLKPTTNHRSLKAIIISLLLATTFEFIHFFTPYRSFTLMDMSANILGVLIGCFLLFIFRITRK